MDVINALKNATDEEIQSKWKEIQQILDRVQHRKDLAETISILRKQYKNNSLIDTIVDISDTIRSGSMIDRIGFKVMCKRNVVLNDGTELQLWFECWGDNSGGWNDPHLDIYNHNIDINVPESIDRESAIEILEQIFDSIHEDVAEYFYLKVCKDDCSESE